MKIKQLSRKQLRKQRKLEKKQRVQKHNEQKRKLKPLLSTSTPVHPKPSSEPLHKQKKNNKIKQQGVDSEDERIAMFEQKLGMKGDNKKYGKLAKKMGFDDDLFNFLDNISKKVHHSKGQKDDQQEQHMDMEVGEQEEMGLMDDMDEQFLKQWQNLQHVQQVQEEQTSKSKNFKLKKNNTVQRKPNEQTVQKQYPTKNKQKPQKLAQQSIPAATECQKKMNSLFNKLSDGNLLYTFRQFISIMESYPKSISYPIFATLFVKFNLLIEKPLVHVMSANIVIAVGLHRAYGDKFMAQLLYQLTQMYLKVQEEEENQQEIKEIGYSKIFEKKKNYVTIICYLYEFSSISSTFPLSIVAYLTKNITNKENVQLIYQVVQKCGVRMRSHDPGTLKEVIQILKKMIQESKLNGTFETTKIKFIEIEINQIRFNKKGLFDPDQRMGFLRTFLSKTIKEQIPGQQRTLDVSFQQFKQQQDTARPNWWMAEESQNLNDKQRNEGSHITREASQQVKQLLELAKSMHFVTEVKKNIFVQLMSSQDYIEASKRLLDLKIKRLEDIATVLVEVGLLESTFNPFYSLVSCKIAAEIPKFRVCLQFAIWDRLKQLDSFEPRKISNLAKFSGWLVSSEEANSSLTILKFFPDLLNVKTEQDVFLKVFFKELFRRSQRDWIIRLSSKLKQEKNKVVRDGIKDYIAELSESLISKKQRENANLLRRLVAAQFETELDNE